MRATSRSMGSTTYITNTATTPSGIITTITTYINISILTAA